MPRVLRRFFDQWQSSLHVRQDKSRSGNVQCEYETYINWSHHKRVMQCSIDIIFMADTRWRQWKYGPTKFEWMNEWTDTSLRYRHWRMCFERLLQAFARWQPSNLFDIAAQPIREYRWIDSYTQLSLRTQFKVATVYSIHTQSLSDVRQNWYPMYYPKGMKARVSPVQSIEPHRILAPTRDLNREPLGPQSRLVTIILPQHTLYYRCTLEESTIRLLHVPVTNFVFRAQVPKHNPPPPPNG